MKKITLFAAAALVTLSAGAEGFYLNGNGSWTGWNESELTRKFQATETPGVYTLNVENLTADFLILEYKAGDTSAKWNQKITPKNGQSSCVEGNAVPYQQLDGGVNWKYPQAISNCVLTLDTNAKTLKAAGVSVANSFTVVYLVGDFGSGWSETNTNFPLTLTAENTYTGQYTFTAANTYFKPKAGNQVLGENGGSDLAPVMGTSYTLVAGGGKAVKLAAGTYNFKVVADQEAETCVLTVTGEGGENPPTPPADDFTGWYVNCPGDFNDWGDNGLAVPEDGIVNFSNLALGNGEFEIKIWNGTSDLYYGVSTPLVNGEWTALTVGGGHMTIEGASETDTYNVSYNCSTNEIKVEKIDYSTWYVNVVGNFNSWGDNGKQPAEGTTVSTHNDLAIGTSQFKVKVWNGAELWYSTGTAIPQNEWVKINGDNAANMTIEEAQDGQKFNVEFNLANTSIKVSPVQDIPDAVSTIAAEAGEAIFFNLQGQRVANPENGIFIRVANGNALKVIR